MVYDMGNAIPVEPNIWKCSNGMHAKNELRMNFGKNLKERPMESQTIANHSKRSHGEGNLARRKKGHLNNPKEFQTARPRSSSSSSLACVPVCLRSISLSAPPPPPNSLQFGGNGRQQLPDCCVQRLKNLQIKNLQILPRVPPHRTERKISS